MIFFLSDRQIEDHLEKSKSVWFAGGEQPTSADFMMMFSMLCLQIGGASSPKIDAYVKQLKERCVLFLSLLLRADDEIDLHILYLHPDLPIRE